jgi:mono/diheme cytochrome c family protein
MKSIFLLALAASLLWASRLGSLVQQAPAKADRRVNPYQGQDRAERAGAKLYRYECAACHGSDGLGIGKTPPLKSSVVEKASPGALFWVLRNGSLRRGMPSFSHLPEPERWQIVTYLKSLNNKGLTSSASTMRNRE